LQLIVTSFCFADTPIQVAIHRPIGVMAMWTARMVQMNFTARVQSSHSLVSRSRHWTTMTIVSISHKYVMEILIVTTTQMRLIVQIVASTGMLVAYICFQVLLV